MTFLSHRRFGAALVAGLVAVAPTSLGDPQDKLTSYTETLPNSVVKIDMVAVPGGKVTIDGKTVEVKPFWIAKTETPWELFDLYLGSGPASPPYDLTEFGPDAIARPSKSYILPDRGWGHAGYPAISLSYETAQMFCRWMAGATKKKYRLPTAAEWELACRAGGGDGKMTGDQADKAAWHAGNSNRLTHPVAKKDADKLGLHDMFGNVGEWATDAEGKPILCGNTYQDAPDAFTPAMRRKYSPKWQDSDPQIPKSRWWLSDGPFAGFRLVCVPE